MQKTKILSQDGIEIIFFKSDCENSKGACLIFGARFFDTSKNGGAEVFLAKNVDVILIYDSRNEWYQNFNDVHFRSITQQLQKESYQQLMAYGISMGGYAAIQFSKHFKVNKVLSFSPQFSIEIPEDTRHFPISQKIKIIHHIELKSIWDQCRYTIISDHEYKFDKIHIDRFIDLFCSNNAMFYNAKHTGHSTVKSFSEQGILKQIVNDFIDGEKLSLKFMKKNRLNSTIYLGFLSAALLRHKKTEISRRILEFGLTTFPNNLFLMKQLGLLYKETREYDKGSEILLKLHSFNTDDCDTCIQLSICLDGANRIQEAIDFAQKAILIDSNREWYHRHLDRLIKRMQPSN